MSPCLSIFPCGSPSGSRSMSLCPVVCLKLLVLWKVNRCLFLGLVEDGREGYFGRILLLRRLPTINLPWIPLRCVCVCVCVRVPALSHRHLSPSKIIGTQTAGSSSAWIGPESATVVLVPSSSWKTDPTAAAPHCCYLRPPGAFLQLQPRLSARDQEGHHRGGAHVLLWVRGVSGWGVQRWDRYSGSPGTLQSPLHSGPRAQRGPWKGGAETVLSTLSHLTWCVSASHWAARWGG